MMEQFWHEIAAFFNKIGLKVAPFAAGFAGALVSVAYEKDRTNWRHAILKVISGATFAGFGSGVIQHVTGIPEFFEGSIGFFIGLFGMWLYEAFASLFRLVSKDPKAAIEMIVSLFKSK